MDWYQTIDTWWILQDERIFGIIVQGLLLHLVQYHTTLYMAHAISKLKRGL